MDYVALPAVDPKLAGAYLQGAVTRSGTEYWDLTEWCDEFAAEAAVQCPPELTPLDLALDGLAICLRETGGGTAPGYRPRGADGSGDWTARHGHWVATPGVHLIEALADLPPTWSRAVVKDVAASEVANRAVYVDAPFPWCIPADGKGWGRKLMQIDYASNQAWLAAAGADETSIGKGLSIYLQKLGVIRRAFATLGEAELRMAAMASYNAGVGPVLGQLAHALEPDLVTTGGNYGRFVWAKRQLFASNVVLVGQ